MYHSIIGIVKQSCPYSGVPEWGKKKGKADLLAAIRLPFSNMDRVYFISTILRDNVLPLYLKRLK